MSEELSKLQLIGKIAEANNKNLELIVEMNRQEDEIERLNNIIKEVREYTELYRGCLDYDKDIRAVRLCKDILEILKKEENNEPSDINREIN